MDGEAIAIKKDGSLATFQDILKRSKRKYNISSMTKDIDIKIIIFDILYLNNHSLLDINLESRREILSQCNIIKSNFIEIDEYKIVDNIKDINIYYNTAIDFCYEGIMIKDPLSKYVSGKKGLYWIKKKQIMDTLDLIVTGGEWGHGKRKNKIGSYVLSCWDNKFKNLIEICNVGTGIDDESLNQLTNEFKNLTYEYLESKIFVTPKIIFEVGFEKIHKNNITNKYSLRFPRVIRIRYDKKIEDADNIEKIEFMYLNQKN